MVLFRWGKRRNQPPKASAPGSRRGARFVRLVLERFEERVTPSNVYQWTGVSEINFLWTTAANWTQVGGTGGMYPGDGKDGTTDVAQFVDPALISGHSPTINGSFSIGEIDFGTATNVTLATDGGSGHGLTLSGSAQIIASNSVGKNTGNDVISAPVTIASSLSVSVSAGTLSLSGTISGTGSSLTFSGTNITVSGNNTYTGKTTLNSNAVVSATSNTALGNGDVTVSAGATLNVVTAGGPTGANLGSGLAGKYYSIKGATSYPPSSFNSLSALQSFVSTLGTPAATDTSATANGQNNGGQVFDYGASGAGFPSAVQSLNVSGGGPTQFMGIWQGVFFAPVAGTYDFDTGSDDGSVLFLDGNLVVNNNFVQTLTVRSGVANLTAGAHALTIAYFQDTGSYGMFADVQGPGLPQQRLPNALMGSAAPVVLQMGSLSGGGTINLANGTSVPNSGLLVGGDNNSTTFNGSITSSGTTNGGCPNLVKTGTGTLVLSTGESYTGSTAISTGVLQLGTATQPISGLSASNVLDNGNLTVYLPSTPIAYNGVISGMGGVTFGGAGGTLLLGGVNTYTGPTIVGGNTLKQKVTNALPPLSAFTVGSGTSSGVVDLNGFSGGMGSITAVGTGTGNTVTNSNSTSMGVSLTLTGTGFTVNVNLPITSKLSLGVTGYGTEILSAANTYTGGFTTITGSTVIMGNSAALPPLTLLEVEGTGTLDMNGYNLSVASLSGTNPSATVTNSSLIPSTLEISTIGNDPYYGALIGALTVKVAASGAGVTTLENALGNTFSGGVIALAGTLAGVPGSLGTGPAALKGGLLQLDPSGAVLGFGGTGTGWSVLNQGGGDLFQSSDVFQLTSAAQFEATSLFYDTPIEAAAGFTASFVYQDQSPGSSDPGNGITFTVQADPMGPVTEGGPADSLGYGSGGFGSNPDGSIANSLAIALNLSPEAPGGVGTALDTDGVINPYVNPGGQLGFLTSGDPIQVVITYNAAAQSLVENLTDTITTATAAVNFTGVNLFSLLGGDNAIVGFTGGTGFTDAMQVVSHFSYVSTAGILTSFANGINAASGSVSAITEEVSSLANSYAITGNASVPSGATVNVSAVQTANQPYSLTMAGSTTLSGTMTVANNGTGTGTLDFDGSLSGTGTTIGTIGGSGNVTLAPDSNYNVVLGGTGAGQFTDLMVSGSLNLAGGNLSVTLANDFVPLLGQTFTIANCGGTRTGVFHQGTMVFVGDPIGLAINYAAQSVTLTVVSMPPAANLVLNGPSQTVAGTSVNFTIMTTDSNNQPVSDFDNTVTLSSSEGNDISPTSVPVMNGMATVPVTVTGAGMQTITASYPGLTSGNTSITVDPGGFVEYLVSDPPATAGSAFAVNVQAADQYGNPVGGASYTGPASVMVNINPASPGSTFPLNIKLNNGLAIGDGIVDTAGSYTLSVTGTQFPSTTAAVNVVPGPATTLAFVTQPGNTAVGDGLSNVTVQVEDKFGNVLTPDSSDMLTLAVASGPGTFTSNSTTTVQVQGGIATFTNLVLTTPGVYTLSASIVALSLVSTPSTAFTIAPLQVVSKTFIPTASGFTVQFNAPFLINSMTPALYGDGFKSTATVAPTVTLTQTTGKPPLGFLLPYQVEGSVVLNQPAPNSLTFLATNTVSLSNAGTPILADGTYVADIASSGPNGLQAQTKSGGYLDGLGTGIAGSGDYTATFTVGYAAAGDAVVWVPPTADGPGQALSAPGNNQAGGGYPLYLSHTTGTATSVAATLTYNPSVLTITSGPGSPGLSVTVTTPGTATVTYSGPALPTGTNTPIGYIGWCGPEPTPRLASGGSLASGMTYYYVITATDNGSESMPGLQSTPIMTGGGSNTVVLSWPQGILADGYKVYRSATPGSGYMLLATLKGSNTLTYIDNGSQNPTAVAPPSTGSTAQVPSGTSANPLPYYREKDLLHLANVSLNGGAISSVVTSDGLHLVAYAGDATGDGSYTNDDSTQITEALLNTNSGFKVYPLVDPVIVADTDGSGFIPADASLQALDASVALATPRLTIPAVPTGAYFMPIGNNVDPTLSLPAELNVGMNGTVTLPVNLDDAHPAGSTGLIAAHLALTYDPKVLTVSAADIHLGSLLGDGTWKLLPTIDQATGQIAITLASTTPISTSQAGSLVIIDFHVVGRMSNPSSIALVASASPDGQYVTTELEDAQGRFTLTPAPTNGPDPRIVSIVMPPAANAFPEAVNSLFPALARAADTKDPMEESAFGDLFAWIGIGRRMSPLSSVNAFRID